MIQYRSFLPDDLFEKCVEYIVQEGHWQHKQTSNMILSTSNQIRFWFMDLQKESIFHKDVFELIIKITSKHFELLRVYANGQTFGQDGDFHTDCSCTNNDVCNHWTFLIYTSSITGNTEFKIGTEGSERMSIIPSKNNAVIFKSNILHRGLAPFDKSVLRVTIAFKLRQI